MSIIVLIFLHVGLSLCVWALFCLHKASKNIRELMDWVYDNSSSEKLMDYPRREKVFGKGELSLNKHLFALFTFQDPWRIYPEPVNEFLADRKKDGS